MYTDIHLFSLLSKIFGSLYFVQNYSPHKTTWSRSLKGIFLGYSRTQKGYKCFCPSKDRLSANVTFFEFKPRVSISLSSSASEDDYDYLLCRETLLNNDESTSENITGKDTLWFQDLIQVCTRWTTLVHVPSLASVNSFASIKWNCHHSITW